MKVEAVTTGAFEETCYLAWGGERRALVFDPGADASAILEALDRQDLEVAAYVCTHGHADHIGALAELHRRRPAPVAMHPADWQWAFSAANQIEPYYPVPGVPGDASFLPLSGDRAWRFADLGFQCIETPGHTPGSCCLFFPEERVLVAGDTLFRGSCGRTDLPGGDPRRLRESLDRLKQLPGEVRVYPGHGPDTTIGHERATNLFMQ